MNSRFCLYNICLIILCSLFSLQVSGQTTNKTVHIKNNPILSGDVELPQGMVYTMDSLLIDWRVKNYILSDEDCSTANSNPHFSDSVYIDRLSRIPSVMEMSYNDVVRRFIDTYNNRLRSQVGLMISACNFYVPIFEEALDAYSLPLELKYLPIIESALKPSAVSRAGASGLWQFMIGTGKMYGLDSNSLVDERRDPIKSTWAAARYLKDLYSIYNDWNLVIAAYNCGPGTVNKAIHRSGGKTDYWSIYNYLPKETRGYVPAFIAANYVMTYYCDHNICPMETSLPADTDTIQITKNLNFEQISQLCNISVDELKSLNPQYKKNIIPGDKKPYTLRMPHNQLLAFIQQEEAIYANSPSNNVRIADVSTKAPAKTTTTSTPKVTQSTTTAQAKPQSTQVRKTTTGNSNDSKKIIYHRIKRGESLSVIARQYKVSVSDLKRWNRLRDDAISAGRQLTIYK